MKKLKENTDENDEICYIFEKYMLDMYKVAKSRLYDEEDVYDAIQETGYRLYKNMKKIKQPEKIKIWLLKVLINECNKIYNRKKKEVKLQEKIYEEELKNVNSNYSNEEIEFDFIIKSLNKDDRLIFSLYYGNKLTIKEISKIIGKNENTIKTRMKRAKEYIKDRLEKGEEKYEK